MRFELEPVPTRFKVIALLVGAALGAVFMFVILLTCHERPPVPVRPEQQSSLVLPWQQPADNACDPTAFIPCDTKDTK